MHPLNRPTLSRTCFVIALVCIALSVFATFGWFGVSVNIIGFALFAALFVLIALVL